MTLFRRQAIERQTHRLEGNGFVGVPAAWQSIGFLLAAALVAADRIRRPVRSQTGWKGHSGHSRTVCAPKAPPDVGQGIPQT